MVRSMKKRKGASLTFVVVLALVLALTLSFGANVTRADAASSDARYTSDYASKQDAIEAGASLNGRIADEGMVLLKNDGTLPLKSGGKGTDRAKVTLFGYKSVKPDGGSNGNDVDQSVGVTKVTNDIYASLAAEGFKTNPVVKAAYTDWMSESSANASDYAALNDIDKFTKDVAYSFSDYNDAAIVVLSATSAPTKDDGRAFVNANAAAFDDPATSTVVEGHSRQMDAAQKKLLDYVCNHFDNVVVIINDSIPMELGYIQSNNKVGAILLSGNPGSSGFAAVGRILSGKVNPSGRLADIYTTDFTSDPTYHNIGHNFLEPVTEGGSGGVMGAGVTLVAGGNQFVDENGKPLDAWFSQYEEGIYVGYRYYETRGYTEAQADASSTWYADNVVYPFGYGLSYTNFDWEIVGNPGGAITSVDQNIKLSVKVTNKGTAAGKDVVELYYTSPYTPGGIEKSHVVLADFAKTDLLAPGASQVVTVTVKASDMASYDYKTAKTYVLEDGSYELKLMQDSHTVKKDALTNEMKYTYTVASDMLANVSDQTGKEVGNAFDDVTAMAEDRMNVLSRESWNMPQEPETFYAKQDGTTVGNKATAQNVLTAAEFAKWDVTVDADYDKDMPWYVADADMPKYVKEADAASRPMDEADENGTRIRITLDQLIDKSIDDPMWEKLLDQLTVKEMANLINNGGFGSVAIPYIDKPQTHDTDGPAGWSGSGTGGASLTKFATAPVIACTWSKELAYEMGKMVGDQALWGRSDTGESVAAYSGWYGPAMNTHRSPFLSRYSEYYSEDGFLAGMMAANAVIGAREKGCYATIKHFAAHEDGSTDRGIFAMPNADEATLARSRTSGLSIIANEQTLREIYLKPFQIAVEQGDPHGVMSSFSRFGSTWAGGSYALLTQVLRNEWGYAGLVVTDIEIYQFLNADQMIRAGGDLVLSAFHAPNCQVTTDETKVNATQLTAMRNAVKNVLFAVANSNAMQVPVGAKVDYAGATLAAGKENTAYTANVATATLNTKHAYSAVKYAVTAGRLPAGLDMDEAGTITGTPQRTGTYTFTVTATADGYTAGTAQFTLEVDEEKSAADIAGGAADKIGGDIDEAVGGITDKLNKTDKNIAGVNTLVIVSLVVGIVGLLAAAGCVVLTLRKKKQNNG